jgi:hypothetical protein
MIDSTISHTSALAAPLSTHSSFNAFLQSINQTNVYKLLSHVNQVNSLDTVNRLCQVFTLSPPEISYITEGSTTHYNCPMVQMNGSARSRVEARTQVYNRILDDILFLQNCYNKKSERITKLIAIYDFGLISDDFIETTYANIDLVNRRVLFAGSNNGKGNEQLDHQPKKYTFKVVHVLEQAQVAIHTKLPSLTRNYVVSQSAVTYFLSKIKNPIHLDREYFPKTEHELLVTLSHMIYFMYSRGMWKHINLLEEHHHSVQLALTNWSNGSPLMTFPQALRKSVVPFNHQNKQLRPYFDFLSYVLKHNDPTNLFVHKYSSQGLIALSSALWTYSSKLISRTVSTMIEGWALSYLKTRPLVGSLVSTFTYVYDIFDGLRKSVMNALKPLIDKITDPDNEYVRKFQLSVKVIVAYVLLGYLATKLLPEEARTFVRVILSGLLLSDLAVVFSDDLIEYIISFIPDLGAGIEDSSIDVFDAQISLDSIKPLVAIVSTVVFGSCNIASLKEFNIRTVSARNITEFLKFIFTNSRDLIDYAYSAYAGKPFFQESEMLLKVRDEFNNWDKYMAQESVYTQLSKDKDKILEIIAFNTRLQDLDKQVRTLKSLTEIEHRRWTTILYQVKQWSDSAHLIRSSQNTRQAPVWINLVGPPGSGKSTLIGILSSAVRYAIDGKSLDSSDRYERSPNKQFWDGYNSQWLVTLDDIYQTADPNVRLQTSMDFISMVNCTPLPLNMAALDRKENTLFTSTLIVTTTNTAGIPTDLGITCSDALVRRCSLNIEVNRGNDLDDVSYDGYLKNWKFTLLNKFGSHVKVRDLTFTDMVSLTVSAIQRETTIAKLALSPPGTDYWSGKLDNLVIPKPHKPAPEVQANPLPQPPKSQPPRQPPRQPPPPKSPPPAQPRPNSPKPPIQSPPSPNAPKPIPPSILSPNAPPFVQPPPSNWKNKAYQRKPYTAQMMTEDDVDETPISVFNNKNVAILDVPSNIQTVSQLTAHLEDICAYPFTFANFFPINDSLVSCPRHLIIAPTGAPYDGHTEYYQELKPIHPDLISPPTPTEDLIPNEIIQDLPLPPAHQHVDFKPIELDYDPVEAWFTGTHEFAGLAMTYSKTQAFNVNPDNRTVIHGETFLIPRSTNTLAYFDVLCNLGLTYNTTFGIRNWLGLRSNLRETLQRVIDFDERRFICSINYYKNYSIHLNPVSLAFERLTLIDKSLLSFPNYRYIATTDRLVSKNNPFVQIFEMTATAAKISSIVFAAAATSYLVWRVVNSLLFTADAQSIDKTQKNIARAVYRKSFYKAKRDRAIRDSIHADRKARAAMYGPPKVSKKNMKQADHRLNKEGAWGAHADRIDTDDSDTEVIEAQGPSVQTTSLVNRMCLNTIEGEITYESGATFITNFFFVKGTQSFAVKHAFQCSLEPNDKVSLISLYARKRQRGSLMFASNQFKLVFFSDRDLCRITFDSSCPSFRDMTHHLKPFDNSTIAERPGRVTWVPYNNDGENLEIRQVEYGTQAVARTTKMSTALGNHTFVNEKWYEVHNLTGYPGACGYPLINDSTSDTTPILGIHVGGKGSRSMAVPISPEDVMYQAEFYMSDVSKSDYVLPNEEDLVKYDTRGLASRDGTIFNTVPYKGEGIRIVNNLKNKPFIPNVNPIKPSPFQAPIQDGDTLLPVIHNVTFFPVRLTSTDGEISPYQKAIDKFSEISVPPVTNKLKEMLLDERMDRYTYGTTVPTLQRRRLTEKEVIFGVPELHIPAMDLTTGIGPPECTLGLKTQNMIQVDHTAQTYSFDPQFKERLDYIKEQCTKNVLPHLALDMLKIETREKERVESNSTRLFEAGSKASIFLWKSLTGHLLSHVEQYRSEHCIKIGMNVHSSEWVELYKKFATHLESHNDPGVLAGDVSRWDKSMLLQLSESISNGLIRNLGFKPETWEANFIRFFVHGTLQTTHFSPIGLYETRQGNSSGGPATSWLNSIYNTEIHVCAFNYLVPEYAWQMHNYVELGIYGDDSYASTSKIIRQKFNMQEIQIFFKDFFALEYTSCDKSPVIPEFMTLNNSNFLCRKFASVDIDGNKYILPQLKEDSIKNSVMWIKDPSSPLCHIAFEQTVNAALMEWSYYGCDVHTKFHSEYTKRMRALRLPHFFNKFNDHKLLWHMYTVH